MKKLSRRSGFSLVELLTVIAIIAILAAIIFPVMSMVKEKARQSQCISNIKQIGTGLSLFKTDNRRYPVALVPEVPGKEFDQAKSDASLLGEYVKGGASIFHCPSSKDTNKAQIDTQPLYPGGKVYRYNSYEGIWNNATGQYEQHYCTNWAADLSAVSAITVANNTPELEQQDYQRQLKFRTPDPDTVVTWCSWHEIREPGSNRGKAIVLFLGGETAYMDAGKVEESKWRVRPE